MHSYNERREATEHASPQRKGGGVNGRTGRRCLCACAALCLTLLTLQGVASGGFAGADNKTKKSAPATEKRPAPRLPVYSPPAPTPAQIKSPEINVTKPYSQPQEFTIGAGRPPESTEINFLGNRQDWSLIKFDRLPVGVRLKVSGKLDGYQESEALEAEHYYPFKTRLPVVLEIKPEALPPIELAYWMGGGNNLQDQAYLKKLSKPEEVRSFVENTPIATITNRQLVKFAWSVPAGRGNVQPPGQPQAVAATPGPQVLPSTTPTPGSSWYSYLTVDYPVLGAVLLLLGLVAAVIFLLFILPWIVRFVRDTGLFRRDASGSKPGKSEKTTTSIKPEVAGGDMYDSLGGDSSTQANQETTTAETTGKKDYSSFRSQVQTFQMDTSGKKQETPEPRVQAQSKPLLRGDEPHEPHPMKMPQAGGGATAGGQDGRRLFELEDRIKRLEDGLGQKVGWEDRLSNAARADVERMLPNWQTAIMSEVERGMKQRLESTYKAVEDLLGDHTKEVDGKLDGMQRQVERAAQDAGSAKQQFLEMVEALGKAEERFRERLGKLQAVAERQTVFDSLYASRLGAVLGENVESLRDGNFHQQVIERLNQFFETGVGRGEALQELRDRGERINAALKEVLECMEGRNPQAASEARSHAMRFGSLVGELASLQSQLATRRATVETTLRVPVSLHAGARQSFLDELGRGIRREVDKLSQPEVYFAGELERLITADLIAVVDNSDKKVGLPPVSPPALEDALQRLFEAAGLRPILPRRGEPFKAAEQDLVEMAQGSGQSLTVERVITRGFYYGEGESKTLLRKAGVTVYR